jgi:hypothetical protein
LWYFNDANMNFTSPVTCADSGAAKTDMLILSDACFPGRGYAALGWQIRTPQGDAVIRLVRVVKLNPQAVEPAGQPHK